MLTATAPGGAIGLGAEKVIAAQPAPLEGHGDNVTTGRRREGKRGRAWPPDGHGPPLQLLHVGLGAQPETQQPGHQRRAHPGVGVQDELVWPEPSHPDESVSFPWGASTSAHAHAPGASAATSWLSWPCR